MSERKKPATSEAEVRKQVDIALAQFNTGMPLPIWEKVKVKFSQDPLIPFGAVATAAALGGGLNAFRKQERQHYQKFMRRRIGFQALTLFATVYYLNRNYGLGSK